MFISRNIPIGESHSPEYVFPALLRSLSKSKFLLVATHKFLQRLKFAQNDGTPPVPSTVLLHLAGSPTPSISQNQRP